MFGKKYNHEDTRVVFGIDLTELRLTFTLSHKNASFV